MPEDIAIVWRKFDFDRCRDDWSVMISYDQLSEMSYERDEEKMRTDRQMAFRLYIVEDYKLWL